MQPVIFLVIAIIAVGVLLLLGIIVRGNKSHQFDKEEYQTRWLRIENSLRKDRPASYPMAVINADKLLDKALMEIGIPGETMGERLKRIGNRFSDIDKVWRAHKVRNMLAHESDYEIDYRTASLSLSAIKQALKELGAI